MEKKNKDSNWGLKVISVMIACLVWFLVFNIEDPVTTKVFSDIPVVETNGEAITSKGKTFMVSDESPVSIRVTATSSVISRLTKDDFEAVADLSKMSLTGAVPVDVKCRRNYNVDIETTGSNNIVMVEIEDMAEKSVNIRVVTRGKLAEDRFAGTGVANPNMITISGPKSVVKSVKEAKVSISLTVTNLMDITTTKEVVLVDKEGNEVDTDRLKLTENMVDVVLPIYKTKTVPIILETVGDVAGDHILMNSDYEPKEIQVAGPDAALNKIDQIVLSPVDLGGAEESIQSTIVITDSLKEDLPVGIVLTEKDVTVAYKADIQPIIERTMSMSASESALIGTRSPYIYQKGHSTASRLIFKIKGPESVIDQLTSGDFKAEVDVTGLEPGEYDLPVTFSTEASAIEFTDKVKLYVTVTGEKTQQ